MRFRRKRWRFSCPYCGGIFFRLSSASLQRRKDRLPEITSMTCDLTCTQCGLMTGYDDFVRMHRGWLARRPGREVRGAQQR